MKTILAQLIVGLLTISFVFSSCQQNEEIPPATGNVEFYLLETYETLPGSFKIDESSIVLANEILVEYDDILSYNPSYYSFAVSEKAHKTIMDLEHSVHGKAFAVVADDRLVYTAYFWPSYSSMSCEWVVADPYSLEINGELRINIGYPGTPPNHNIPDRRNNEQIINIFKRDGKLKF